MMQRPALFPVAATAAALALAGCAAPPLERYTAPAADLPSAELKLNLMPPSRNRGASLAVRGAAKCAPPGVASLLNRTVEEPPRLLGASRDNRMGEVVRVPAGVPLPLQFRYFGPGEDYIADFVVQLVPGGRYVFDHEIPGTRFSLIDSTTTRPATVLPPKLLHEGLKCPG